MELRWMRQGLEVDYVWLGVGISVLDFKAIPKTILMCSLRMKKEERTGDLPVFMGGLPREEGRMEAFRTVLEDCTLRDLGFSGRWFTWERGNLPETNIRERLDRGVAMDDWISLFPNFQVRHMSHSFSDHCPLLITTKQEDKRRFAKEF
ncbi:hypothetical protein Golob_023916 [Gossypium lobatum]|uniref:Reverse transcriptase n=1 Tax=Gossypium lobatum TaxID=34289 RepID=A0A7J8NJR3_9ROSI|nr:hypothetical protein [Gossypium lobatum]